MSRAKRATLLQLMLTLAILGNAAETARAGGFGGYVEGEYATSKIDDHGIDRGFEAGMGGLGILYDGVTAADKLLSYRFSFGYRVGDRDFDEGGSKTINGFALDQTLGFGVLRSSRYRAWGGPSLRLNFDWYESSGDVDIVDVSIGIGPRLGINLHLNEQISLTTSIAYHYMYLSELIESNGFNRTIDGPQHTVGINLGVLWRSKDDIWDED